VPARQPRLSPASFLLWALPALPQGETEPLTGGIGYRATIWAEDRR
jgi:hypothetical protein